MNRSDIKIAFKTSLPVMAGYIALGIGFGIILKTKGYGIVWALAMSLFIYAGSMQYVAINLITAGASLLTTVLTTLMVNARHLFYGISMVDKYKGTGKKKLYLAFTLTDETYSIVCSDELNDDISNPHEYYFLVSLLDQIYWVIGSLLGSVLGGLITFNVEGIDFALTALFITIFVEQWLSVKEHRPALIGLLSSVICLLIFGENGFLIPTMLCITLVLLAMKKHMKGE